LQSTEKSSLSSRQVKPAFLFIGPSKSASTWFFEILKEHPAVYVPPQKGLFFFNEFHERGNDWYERFFSAAAEGQVVGEVCHDYLADADALSRIRDYRPDVRLICCLRHPYERALSSWRFRQRNGERAPTLVETARRWPSVFEEGHYATHLETVLRYFPRAQLLVFFFEEVALCPESVASRVYDFIGVDAGFQPPSLHRRVNTAAVAKWRTGARQIARLDHYARVHGFSRLVAWLKSIGWLRSALRRVMYKPVQGDYDLRKYLREFPPHVVHRYEREIGELERLLGRDLSHWRGLRWEVVENLPLGLSTASANEPPAGGALAECPAAGHKSSDACRNDKGGHATALADPRRLST
jgi:hypothetical protein